LGAALIAFAANPILAGGVASAEEAQRSSFAIIGDMLVPDSAQVTLGIGPRWAPDYVGSNDYEWSPDPQIFVRLNGFLSLSEDGADINLLGVSNFQFGPAIGISGTRDQDNNSALNGLGDVGRAFELGGFARARFGDPYSLRIRYKKAVASGHRGATVDAQAVARVFKTESFSAAVGVRGTWTDRKYAETYYGISPAQSMRSGLPIFAIGSGLHDVRLSLTSRWQFTESLGLNSYMRYSRLLGDKADSPIVDPVGSADQFMVGSYVSYSFTFE
jgi:outer membrane scaffolding protein for murein synthesis (MipA/OmpV family)